MYFLTCFICFITVVNVAAFGSPLVNLEIGAPFSMLTVSGRDGSDQLASSGGLMVRAEVVAEDSQVAAVFVSKNSLGVESSLIASGTGVGLSWATGGPYRIQKQKVSNASFSYQPATTSYFSLLINNSRFDLSRAKPIPEDAVFLDEAPIQRGGYIGIEVSYGLYTLLDTGYLATNLFYQQSLSSPGQNISVAWAGLSLSYKRNIFGKM